jgi:hypothetical protein
MSDNNIESHKGTLKYILHEIPPWVRKDAVFNISSSVQNADTLHHKYHQEILSFIKWAEIASHS